jgi:hypothetical protein
MGACRLAKFLLYVSTCFCDLGLERPSVGSLEEVWDVSEEFRASFGDCSSKGSECGLESFRK